MARCDHLFVYGTLMSAAKSRLGRGERARLFREGRSLGAAFARGRLYDLGRYPGMTDPHGPRELVHGEVVRLDDPSRSFLGSMNTRVSSTRASRGGSGWRAVMT